MTEDKYQRPSWDIWFMRLAYVTAQRGSCNRLRVGALITRDRDKRIISGGYNGAPRGLPDCLEVGCDIRKNLNGTDSCFRTLHAESNALDLAGQLSEPHTLYCTVTPCRNCALRIIQNGWIKRVVYHQYYESQGTKEVEALFAYDDPLTALPIVLMEQLSGATPLIGMSIIDLLQQMTNGGQSAQDLVDELRDWLHAVTIV